MNTPILSPYLGSWEDLVSALLENPFLGSPQHTRLSRWRTHYPGASSGVLTGHADPPRPDGPFTSPIIGRLATLAGMKELAETMESSEAARSFASTIESEISRALDDFCGTPWPGPGSPPWASILAVELVTAANTQTGAFRAGLMQIARQAAERALDARQTMAAGA
jgi:hypothetical protein